MSMERILVQLPKELLQRLDVQRGLVPRSAFIRSLIEARLSERETVRKRSKESLKISIQPGMLSGTPCLDGTRVPAEAIAEIVAYHGVEEAVEQFEITPADCALCSWYVTEYRYRTKVGKHFKAWAEANFKAMWSGQWNGVEEPPRIEQP